MATTYNGVAGGGANPGSPSIVIPADLDPLNVGTVNAGLQKLTDYVANIAAPGRIRSGSILRLTWNGTQAGTFGANSSIVTLVPQGGGAAVASVATLGTDVTGTISPVASYKLTANVTGVYRAWFVGCYTNAGTAASIISLQKNGATSVLVNQTFGPLLGATAQGSTMMEQYISLTAADYLQLGIYTIAGSGSTYSISVQGLTIAETYFGMERVA